MKFVLHGFATFILFFNRPVILYRDEAKEKKTRLEAELRVLQAETALLRSRHQDILDILSRDATGRKHLHRGGIVLTDSVTVISFVEFSVMVDVAIIQCTKYYQTEVTHSLFCSLTAI